EVIKPLPEGAVLFDEDAPVADMRPADAPQTETVDEFVSPLRGKPPLPKAPKADDAPIEGKEVRTSKAGGFDDAAKEIDLEETRRLMQQEGLTGGTTEMKATTTTSLPAADTTVSAPPTAPDKGAAGVEATVVSAPPTAAAGDDQDSGGTDG